MGMAKSELMPESTIPSVHSWSLMFSTSPEQATLSARLSKYRETFSPSAFCLELSYAPSSIQRPYLCNVDFFFFLFPPYFLTLFFVCFGEFKSNSLENVVLSHDSSTSNTAALSHFNSLWARCIIFMITLSMDVCSSNRSWTTSNKFCNTVRLSVTLTRPRDDVISVRWKMSRNYWTNKINAVRIWTRDSALRNFRGATTEPPRLLLEVIFLGRGGVVCGLGQKFVQYTISDFVMQYLSWISPLFDR